MAEPFTTPHTGACSYLGVKPGDHASLFAPVRQAEEAGQTTCFEIKKEGVAVLLSLTLLGGAQSPQQTYEISWWTVDGGGVTLTTGDAYRLGGTVGQPDAGVMTGGDYSLGGGLWRGASRP